MRRRNVGWEIAPSCHSGLALGLSSQKHDDAHYAWSTDYLVYANLDYSGTYVKGGSHLYGDLCFNDTHAPGTTRPRCFGRGSSKTVLLPHQRHISWPGRRPLAIKPLRARGKKVLMRKAPTHA
jgi:hypothetical protein